MARYIENLNSCTDPTSGDYFWIVDASASSSDKDRKVDVGLFAQKAVANTWTAAQTFSGTVELGATTRLSAIDNGADIGRTLIVERNINATTPAPASMALQRTNSSFKTIWLDNSLVARVDAIVGVTNAQMAGGTVIGTQTSSLDSKDVSKRALPSIEAVLGWIAQGANAVRPFCYKEARGVDEDGNIIAGERPFNGEEFDGVVVDYAPRYGMDRDAAHPAGKSLNEIVILGDLLRAVAWLVEREQTRSNA
jgi:hypothetical protein